MYKICNACPRKCNALRSQEKGDGFCRKGFFPEISYAGLHRWEEPCIIGGNGSGAIFFTGCSLQCVYCQNHLISRQNSHGKIFSPEELSDLFFQLIDLGASNINLVNPTHFTESIIEALRIKQLPVPVIYNTGGYESVETIRKLEGMIDIYLTDFKYFDSELSFRYSKAKDYSETAKSALTEMMKQRPQITYDEKNQMMNGTIVRHLILPGHTHDSFHIIDYLNDLNQDYDFLFSLMAQYVPHGIVDQENYPEINRKLTKREYEKVQNYLFQYNIDGYVQDLSSASLEFIPDFSTNNW